MSVHGGPANWWTDYTEDGQSYITTKGVVTPNLFFNIDASLVDSYPGSGTTWNDLSGNLNTGTFFNYTTPVSDELSISFNNTTQYVSFGNAASFTPDSTGGLTIEAWINPASFGGSSLGRIFDKQNAGAGYVLFLDNSTVANGLRYGTQTVTAAVDADSVANVITLSTWQQVAVTQLGSLVTFYVNGNLVKVSSLAFPFPTVTSRTVYIANRGDTLRGFDGKISSVRYYNRSLSAAEIQRNFNALRGRFGI